MERSVDTRQDRSITSPTVMAGVGGGTAWGAILAGAVAAAALSLILLALGSGLGLSAVSPWSYQGASAAGFGMGAIVWLLFMAAAASGLGGYLAGRLRPKWVEVTGDESFFRDSPMVTSPGPWQQLSARPCWRARPHPWLARSPRQARE